ncbi:hypothetical protein [Paraburkholderia sp. CI3]|uniref:hypothetical protein n=1 Tax=Paraburkholderia sp. CI3 TaxID=2991060 RepID=UPI003D1FF9E6
MKKPLPVVQKPVIDNLAFVLQWAADSTKEEQNRLLSPVRERIRDAIAQGVCNRAYPNGNRYIENIFIPFEPKRSAFVQIGAVQPERQNGGIRISVNPAKFRDGDSEYLHDVIAQLIGAKHRKLWLNPLLNRIDLAVDILYANLDGMLVSYSNSQRRTVFGKRIDGSARIETYNFGSVSSDYLSAVYDKRVERVDAALRDLAKNGDKSEKLHENAIRQVHRNRDAPDMMRVEIRGRKMRGLRLWELESLPNRFTRFHFADLSQGEVNLHRLVKQAFLAMCRQDGVRAALAQFKGTPHEKEVRAFWQSRQALWWQPDELWADACLALRESGLFPRSSFNKPKIINLAAI